YRRGFDTEREPHADGRPIRVGVVGCGAVAERYHLPAMLASADITVVAFADPVIGRADALASRVNGARAVSSHRDLIDDLDLVVLAVPNAAHASIAIELLEAGVHVLVEKPMARTTAECDAMRAAAERHGAILAIGHDFRFFPVAQF